MTLLLLQFNNYFNRIVKKYSTIEDYISNSSNYHYTSNTINFNPNDQIVTEQIINWDKTWNPDYLLCIDKDNNICGRWFITKTTRTRGLQYSLSLKRDTVADKYETIISSPCFVQKGFVNAGNPLIFNKEEFNCNQIKKQEMVIPDSSLCSWIVLYYNLEKKSDLTGTVSSIGMPYIDIGTTRELWTLYARYHENGYKRPYAKRFQYRWKWQTFNYDVIYDSDCKYYNFHDRDKSINYNSHLVWDLNKTLYAALDSIQESVNDNKITIQSALSLSGEPQDSFENFVKWNNKIIKTSDNKFYRVKINITGQETDNTTLPSGSLYDALLDSLKISGSFREGWSGTGENAFGLIRDVDVYSLDAIEITNEVKTYNFDFSQCQDIVDQPYGILALPYQLADSFGRKPTFGGGYELVEGLSLAIAKELTKAGVGQDKKIYDCQIVPYCPSNVVAQKLVNTIDLQLNNLNSDEFSYINDSSSNKCCFALHPISSRFTKNIDVRSSLITAQMYEDDDVKVENQCTFYRLCSPNYNGQFEFNRARNISIDYFNIDCTYKPYQPYIHVNPDFKGLYGRDFNDARGLVCGGDFSMSVVSDSFETYKLQNKNYNEIFNRQIENMDVQHGISMVGQVAQSVAGVGSGAVSGFVSGGGPVGAIAGAAASAVAGAADIALAQKAYKENKDFATDMHEFQLDNIKAMPNSLTKVDAYNNNNKIWPFLERYSCTDEEKEIFKNKLTYEGMTINAVGFITNYVGSDRTFIKGQLIRLEGIEEDSNFAQDIYNEISKGVYI